MHLLQVCNVGDICGGTAACAWTITRALPACRHSLLFLSPVTEETGKAFPHCRVEHHRRVDEALLRRFDPDLVILHNVVQARCSLPRSAVVIQYQHSLGRRIRADLTVTCSRWLAARVPDEVPVLYQGVPRPPGRGLLPRRHLDDELIVGRICTPSKRKWPDGLLPIYSELSRRFPDVHWEFVGAPDGIRTALAAACRGRASFLPANWQARSHLWRWHALLYHHPTLTETFGRTVSEAMLAGCIPVVDRRGGFIEQIEEGETGFLAESREEFGAALERLHDPPLRWEISRRARDAADQSFSLPPFSLRLNDLFRRIAG